MKKLFAALLLTLTFGAIVGTSTPQDLPTPLCYPCSS
jgi:hypothetical protein